MQFTLSEIKNILNAEVSGNYNPQKIISALLTDSRKLLIAEQTVFFALKTNIRNGHDFIDDLYSHGVKVFVIDFNFIFEHKKYKYACFLRVESPMKSFQSIIAEYRKRFNIPVIAITGSNGKTIVKEWLYYLLSNFRKTLRSPKSYNSQIGVPHSVSMLESYHKYAVFEAGISQPDEMEALENIIKPNYGIFTNIGPAHDENFKSTSQKITEKLKLFKNVNKITICDKHKNIINTGIKHGIIKKENLFIWGKKSENNVQILDCIKKENKTYVKVKVSDLPVKFNIPFTDYASYENAMNSFTAMVMLGFEADKVAKYMENLPTVSMRMELIDGINNCVIINDAYNSDIYSLTIALDFLKQQQKNRTSCLILSDILQTGIPKKRLYLQIAELLQLRNINKFIGIGPDIYSCKHLFINIKNSYFFSDIFQFISDIKFLDFKNEIILIKGARKFTFERIVKLLEHKTHQTVMEINLNAIHQNLNVYKGLLKPETKIMVILKAFSYGAGSYEISRFLEYCCVNYIGVAYADEGVELRKCGITIPIMIMAPEKASVETIVYNNLEPVIYNFESLSWLEPFYDDIIKIHLEFDTGMHRLGFDLNDIPLLCEKLGKMSNIKVVSVFSHLAVADNISCDDFTQKQLFLFDEMYKLFCKLFKDKPIRHILNSAGVVNYPYAQYDMIRLGIGLYGVQPVKEKTLPLQNVVSLKTHIISIKNISKDERIGYGKTFTCKKNMRIAVIPIGYADGFRRTLGNGKGFVYVNGKKCKVLGNVCMDMTIIDVSGLNVNVNDEVIIFDQVYNVTDFAKDMNTIPYEVLTQISQRVKRQYIME